MTPCVPTPPSRPLLKWAGGKRQLLPRLRRYYPAAFGRYLEPFVGSGAVFFDLYAAGRLDARRVLLTDVNADLIGCYRAVRDEANAVIKALAGLDEEHRARGVACYYDVRDRRFNPARAALGDVLADRYTPALAAMLIYLNRTGFNGLFRVNRRGEFNVPAGRYTDPRICDGLHVRAVARAFGAPGVSIEHARFDATLSAARTGDFVYCDPPYAPLSRTSNFSHYTADGFTADDHRALQKAAVAAARRGAAVLLSNSSAPEIARAYADEEARRAGFTVHRVAARRAINAQATRRGPVDELIVTNAIAARGRLRMAKSPLRAAGAGRRRRAQ